MDAPPEPSWTVSDSAALYHVPSWGETYFGINEHGHAVVTPHHKETLSIDIQRVVAELAEQGVQFPVLLRFQDLLNTRVVQLNEAFRAAIAESGFEGAYKGVYPIKVNQLREVVEDILEAGVPYGFGLECGSKAELIATLPHLDNDDTLLICNGYKDEAMLRLMLTFQALGKTIIPVVEKYNEFEMLTRLSEEMEMPPSFGLRIRLATVGAGQWATSSGDHSKFGVPTPELLDIVQHLETTGQRDALRLLHFHLGSQISDIQALKNGVKEITRVYAHLVKRGINVQYVDVGGGLGVNYDAIPLGGGRGGVDYTMQEYANAIAYAVKEVCDAEGVPHPTLVSENGRALTAHHSVLVMEAIGVSTRDKATPGTIPGASDHEINRWLYEHWQRLHPERGETFTLGQLLEAYHDTIEQRRAADSLFGFGYLDLEQKALTERLYWSVCTAINQRIHRASPDWLPHELHELDDLLVDQVLCDFSVFQSMMDYWSIGQRFPIMPIDRLDEKPQRRATLVDLTCDSDGKVNRFVSPDGEKRFLDLHKLRDGERYFLGVFLMGAYQDILGDTHNLFGSVNEAHVYLDPDEPGNYYIENFLPGTTIEEMLARVQYFPSDLQKKVQTVLRKKTQDGTIRAKTAKEILEQYRAFFDAYTYYEPTLPAPDGARTD